MPKEIINILKKNFKQLIKSFGQFFTKFIFLFKIPVENNSPIKRFFNKFNFLLKIPDSKKEETNFSFKILYFISIILVISLTIFYIARIRIEIFELGYKIVKLEKEAEKLEEERRLLLGEITKLSSYNFLKQQNKALGIYLIEPEEWIKLYKK